MIHSTIVSAKTDSAEKAPTDFLSISTDGTAFVNSAGETVIFKGVNLGSWFLIESWMLGIGDIPDQHTFHTILDERFGKEKREALINLYRDNWITNRDFKLISKFGMNVIRLPFHYSMVMDKTEPGMYKESGFVRLDNAISMAKANGLYVILDLHGAPGGQSTDQPTGRIDSNELWDSPEYQEMTVNLWKELALRYHDEPAIAAYDILNEPYGEGPRSGLEVELKQLCERIYATIRETGDEHVILFPSTQEGFFFYDSPEAMGATNLGFTEHYYPGLFHGEPSVEGHARFISDHLVGRREILERWQAPFLVGEFNVVFNHTGGDRMMRHYWDLYESYGWAATMWSYKLIKNQAGVHDDNWYLVTNKDSVDIPDMRTDSLETIKSFFASLSTMELSVDEALIESMHTPTPSAFALPDFQQPLRIAPSQDELAGWTMIQLANATPQGGLEVKTDGSLTLYAGGDDIFGKFDSCSYLWKSVNGPFVIEATFTSLEATEQYAKAGLMLRDSNKADSPMFLLNVFKDGSLALCQRNTQGKPATEKKFETAGWPIKMRIAYEDGMVTAAFKQPKSNWTNLRPIAFNANRVGLAATSGDLNQIAALQVSDLHFTPQTAEKSL